MNSNCWNIIFIRIITKLPPILEQIIKSTWLSSLRMIIHSELHSRLHFAKRSQLFRTPTRSPLNLRRLNFLFFFFFFFFFFPFFLLLLLLLLFIILYLKHKEKEKDIQWFSFFNLSEYWRELIHHLLSLSCWFIQEPFLKKW